MYMVYLEHPATITIIRNRSCHPTEGGMSAISYTIGKTYPACQRIKIGRSDKNIHYKRISTKSSSVFKTNYTIRETHGIIKAQ
jgi:hypothetical protein